MLYLYICFSKDLNSSSTTVEPWTTKKTSTCNTFVHQQVGLKCFDATVQRVALHTHNFSTTGMDTMIAAELKPLTFQCVSVVLSCVSPSDSRIESHILLKNYLFCPLEQKCIIYFTCQPCVDMLFCRKNP